MKANESFVSIIILNWNGLNDTIECIESLKKIDYKRYEIYIVDNNSEKDDSIELEKKYKDFIKLIKNKENFGFAKGNNIAINQILLQNRSKYILLLNNDTIVKSNFLTELVKIPEVNDNIVIVDPKIYYYNQEILDKIWSSGGIINWKDFPGYKQITENFSFNEKKYLECDWISGAAMLIKVLSNYPIFLNENFFWL